jgi:tungstate transport system permease protein
MGLPPVVVGLFVTIMLWRGSVLGFLDLLYTPGAMILAQVVIAFPIVTGLTMAALQSLNPRLPLQLLALGASRFQAVGLLLREAKLPVLAAVMAGFGGVISEVGAVLMVGGNIKGQTRVLTTATVLETRMGNFELAIALGILLLVLTFAVNLALTRIQQRTPTWPKS